MVTGTILPEVKRCLCRAPPPPKSAWRQTETTMSGLRMYTQGPAALLCSPGFLTSFFCEKITQVSLTRREIKRGHILEFACSVFFFFFLSLKHIGLIKP